MLTPIELIKATVDGMMERGFGRIVNITSSAVKAPIDILGLSNRARSGLTGFVAGIARKTVRKNVTINNLLPGPFDTDRLRATCKPLRSLRGGPLRKSLRSASGAIPRAALATLMSSEKLRIPLFGAGRLHHWTKHIIGWRGVPRDLLER